MVPTVAGRRGFSLAEILLALALITVVILALLGLSLYIMKAGNKSRDMTAGVMVAEQVLERLVYEAETNPGAAVWAANSQSVIYQQQVVTVSPCVFNVTTYVSDVVDGPGPPLFVAATNSRLKRLESLVVWQDAPQGKAGQGRLQVRSTRLLHEQ